MSTKSKYVSMAVVRRLPKYYRYLNDLLEKGVHRISSKELSEIIGFTASQIRQDLNNYGGFGQQGYGYNVQELFNGIQSILGLDREYNVVIVGAGNIGQALTNYPWLQRTGFTIRALFDVNPRLIGMTIRDLEVHDVADMGDFIDNNNISIAMICTPREQAQSVADILGETKIEAVWNFAQMDLNLPENIVVENIHLNDSLFVLSYLLQEKVEEAEWKRQMEKEGLPQM